MLSATSSATTQPAAVGTRRRRQRPYLNWLERSRDNWKRKATAARADASRLERSLRLLRASRDRWREKALDLRREFRLARLESAKNSPRS